MFDILHLIPSLGGGGAERQLSMLAAEQSKRGSGVHVGVRRGGVYEGSLRRSGVVVHMLGDHKGVSPLLLARINSVMRQVKPKVVHTWLPQMDIVGGIVSVWNSVPWIISERTSGPAFERLRVQAWARNSLARYAHAVVANSLAGAAYWRATGPRGVPILTVANAVDVAMVRDAISVFGEHSDSSDEMKDILVVGRLGPEKGLEIVIRAVSLVPKKYEIRVFIIGEGPLGGEIEIRIRDAGLDGRILLLPFRPSWWGMLKRATALVSMSRYEGSPNVVLETMAAGCPLIVSDIPPHRELLGEDSAIFVPPDAPASLAQAIVSVLSDPVSARIRAERASACVAGLTVQMVADAYESVYQKVVNRVGEPCAEF